VKRFFADANVLWSAARKPDSLPWKWLTSDKAKFVTSHYALEEARRNLPKEFSANLDKLAGKLEIVADAFGALPAGVRLPAKDVPILATAAMAGADFLVTGDNDFAPYFGRSIGGVKIILPRNIPDEI
jgi:hypothetical protein